MSIEFLITALVVVVSPGTGVLYTLAAGRQTAAYQHNQTDLEFVRAQAREIKGGALTGTTSPSARTTKSEVAIETLEIAHEGFND